MLVSFASVVCCVGRGLCDGMITRSEDPYRIYVSKCDLETSKIEAAWARTGLFGQRNRNSVVKNIRP